MINTHPRLVSGANCPSSPSLAPPFACFIIFVCHLQRAFLFIYERHGFFSLCPTLANPLIIDGGDVARAFGVGSPRLTANWWAHFITVEPLGGGRMGRAAPHAMRWDAKIILTVMWPADATSADDAADSCARHKTSPARRRLRK